MVGGCLKSLSNITAHCLVPSVYCTLSTAKCPLSNEQCPLPINKCQVHVINSTESISQVTTDLADHWVQFVNTSLQLHLCRWHRCDINATSWRHSLLYLDPVFWLLVLVGACQCVCLLLCLFACQSCVIGKSQSVHFSHKASTIGSTHNNMMPVQPFDM